MPIANEDHRREVERALQSGDAEAVWTRISEEIERQNNIGLFFGNDDDSYYDSLGRDAKISTLNRQPSRASFVKFHMLFTGSTLDEVVYSQNIEDYKRMGDLAIRMLSENKILDTMTPQEREESVEKYGRLYYTTAQKLEEAELPAMDLNDPASRASVSFYYGVLRELGIDYSQTKGIVQHEKGFSDVYGGDEAMEKMDARIDAATAFAKSMRLMADRHVVDEERMAAFLTVRHFSDRFFGKKIKDLSSEKTLVADIDAFFSQAHYSFYQMEDTKKEAILDHIRQGGKEPKEELDAIDRTILVKMLDEQEKLWDRFTDERRFLPEVEHGRVRNMEMLLYGKEDKAQYYKIARRSGEFALSDKDSAHTKEEKEALLEEADLCFRNLCHEMNIHINHPVYREAEFKTEESLFFIDGVPAMDYVRKKYPSIRSDDSDEFRKLAHAEIVSAALSGEHHVEAAQVGLKKNGAYEVAVTEVKADVSQLDGQERFYHTKPSKKAEKFYAADTGREQRLNKIRNQVSEKFAIAMRNQINREQYEQTDYGKIEKQYNLKDITLNRQYFNADAMQQLQGIPTEETSELLRGDYGGLRNLAQCLAIARNPQIHLADLVDPKKFIQEKQAAGAEVAAAFSALFTGPDKNNPEDKAYLKPAADIMKTIIKQYPEMDVREEMAYVLGQPLDMKAEELKKIMDKPENMVRISGLSSMISSLSVDTFQALEAVYKSEKFPISKLDPAASGKYPPLYQELSQMLTAEDRKRYQNAIDATRGLVIEKKWNTAVKGTMMGEAHRNTAQDVATRVMGDYIRDQVISCGKMGDFPNPYQLQMISAFGSKEFKALQAEVQKAQAAGKQEAAMEYVMIHSVDPDFRKQLLPKDLDEKMKPKAAAREKVSLEELQKKEAPKKEEKKVHEAPEKTHEAPQVRPRSKSFPR